MEVVQLFVCADCVHVGVDAKARHKAHLGNLEPLPLCQGMDNFHLGVAHVLYVKFYSALYAVKVIIHTRTGAHKKRCRNAGKVQFCGKSHLEKVFNHNNSMFGLFFVQQGIVPFWNVKFRHINTYLPSGGLENPQLPEIILRFPLKARLPLCECVDKFQEGSLAFRSPFVNAGILKHAGKDVACLFL